MAHSALETTTQTAPTTANLSFHVSGGDYKELAAVSYEKEAETKGGLGFNGAKVCERRGQRKGWQQQC